MSEDAESGDISTANTMRERAGESRVKLWLLLGANRLHVTAVLALAVFVAFTLGVSGVPEPMRPQLQTDNTVEWLFSTMIGAIITGTTLVVTISQLVLSQENGPLGEQRDRMENAMDFRDFTEELIGSPSPADPSAFLKEIITATQRRAEALREEVAENDDDQLREEVDEFTDSVIGNAETVREQIEGQSFGGFDVLFAALNFNYGWKIFQVERIANEYEDSLSDEEIGLLDELKTALSLFGPAREHVKTLYFEWELITLSQMILYAAVPALVIAGIMVTVVETGAFPGRTLGVLNITWTISVAFTITLVPFLLFAAYVLRVVTVAKRTLAIEPLILRESQR